MLHHHVLLQLRQVRFADSLENVSADKFEDLVGRDMAFVAGAKLVERREDTFF